jgi:hypothetical protein
VRLAVAVPCLLCLQPLFHICVSLPPVVLPASCHARDGK